MKLKHYVVAAMGVAAVFSWMFASGWFSSAEKNKGVSCYLGENVEINWSTGFSFFVCANAAMASSACDISISHSVLATFAWQPRNLIQVSFPSRSGS